mmetsp:Transcript_51465/g.123812  ORF Transcript_51465/g.123812 Transcript_51465/m.123812 type:complete len:261 (-) Transcript_51465:160-942(-)
MSSDAAPVPWPSSLLPDAESCSRLRLSSLPWRRSSMSGVGRCPVPGRPRVRGCESMLSVWNTSSTRSTCTPSEEGTAFTSPGFIASATARASRGRVSSRCSSSMPAHPMCPPSSAVAQVDATFASSSNLAPPCSWPSSISASSALCTSMCRTRTAVTLLERTASTSAFHSRVLSPVATSDARRPPDIRSPTRWPLASTMSSRRGFFATSSDFLGTGTPIFRRIIASAAGSPVSSSFTSASSSRLSRPSRLASLSTPIARM